MLVSSTLMLVVITTLVFGTFMGQVQNFLVPPSDADHEEVEEMQRTKSENLLKILSKDRATTTHYDIVEHPNEIDDVADENDDPNEPFSWPKSSFVKWFVKYDERVLRPFFIRKYSRAVQILQDEHQELIQMKF